MKRKHLIWIVAAFGAYYFWKKKHAAAAPVALPNAQVTLQPPPALPNAPAVNAGSLSGYRY